MIRVVSVLLITAITIGVAATRGRHGLSRRGSNEEKHPTNLRRKNVEIDMGLCPPCDLLFGNIPGESEDGTRVKHVEVQERGEPKSGTGFMFEWAGGMLVHTCDYLNKVFGESSCTIKYNLSNDNLNDLKYMHLEFDPEKAEADPNHCACDIDRVVIEIVSSSKHRLPLDHETCRLSHGAGLIHSPSNVCTFFDGRVPEDSAGLYYCMKEALTECTVADTKLQMVSIRDPLAMAVSTFFFEQTRDLPRDETAMVADGNSRSNVALDVQPEEDEQQVKDLEEYVSKMLPTLCRWVAVRYMLFSAVMSAQARVFWYDEALANPLAWHRSWLNFIGLQLPSSVVEAATDAAVRHDFSFHTKGMDAHPGTKSHSYRDVLSPELIEEFEAVLQVWLPPTLLTKLGR